MPCQKKEREREGERARTIPFDEKNIKEIYFLLSTGTFSQNFNAKNVLFVSHNQNYYSHVINQCMKYDKKLDPKSRLKTIHGLYQSKQQYYN